MDLIDIGVNLTGKQFKRDLDDVVNRAVGAGVGRMVVTGTSERASQEAAKLVLSYPGVLFSTAGVHPHDASSCSPAVIETLRNLAQQDGVVAIGECGLDFNRDYSPRPVQEKWFEAQLELAAELNMPVFLHERDAHERFAAIVKPWLDKVPAAVVHCFTGAADELAAYLDMGCHIGITGWICDERRGLHLRDLVAQIPPDRLMIETDAPWLTPRDLRPKPKGGRNEPAFLPHIARTVAACAGRKAADVARDSTRTAQAFFSLP